MCRAETSRQHAESRADTPSRKLEVPAEVKQAHEPSCQEADAFKEFVEWKLHADVEVAKFGIAC